MTICIWFERDCEEAVQFYLSTFNDIKETRRTTYGENIPMPAGSIMSSVLELKGQKLMLLNGGPYENAKASDRISFMVECADQAEIDKYWNALADGGRPGPCGWIADRFGVAWQIIPHNLDALLNGNDKASGKRVMEAMMKMTKLDIAALEAAGQA